MSKQQGDQSPKPSKPSPSSQQQGEATAPTQPGFDEKLYDQLRGMY